MTHYSIIEIEGIGSVYAAKLQAIGIRTTEKFLDYACTRKGRKDLADQVGIDEKKILKWANMADLMRVNGVGEEYSELLEAAGVDTVKELRHRNPVSLHAKMLEVNSVKKLVRALPTEKAVSDWVGQAKTLEPMLTY